MIPVLIAAVRDRRAARPVGNHSAEVDNADKWFLRERFADTKAIPTPHAYAAKAGSKPVGAIGTAPTTPVGSVEDASSHPNGLSLVSSSGDDDPTGQTDTPDAAAAIAGAGGATGTDAP